MNIQKIESLKSSDYTFCEICEKAKKAKGDQAGAERDLAKADKLNGH